MCTLQYKKYVFLRLAVFWRAPPWLCSGVGGGEKKGKRKRGGGKKKKGGKGKKINSVSLYVS